MSETTAAGMMAEVWQQGVKVIIVNAMSPASTHRGTQMWATSCLLSLLTTYGDRIVRKWTFDLTRRIAFIFMETS